MTRPPPKPAAHKASAGGFPLPRVGLPGSRGLPRAARSAGASTRGRQACWFLPFLLHFHAEVSTDPFGRFFFPIPGSTRSKGWLEVSGGVSGLGREPAWASLAIQIFYSMNLLGKERWRQVGVILVIQSPDNGWLTEVKGSTHTLLPFKRLSSW